MTILVPNLEGSVHCTLCCDEGQLVVAQERRSLSTFKKTPDGRVEKAEDGHYFADVYGPCPECERGNRVEFPKKNLGPWGSLGYWRGRDHSHLIGACTCSRPKSSDREMREWLTMLRGMAARVGRDPDAPQPHGGPEPPPPDPEPDPTPEGGTDAPTATTETAAGDAGVGETDSTETATAGMVGVAADGVAAATHLCPAWDPPREVPYSVEECAKCSPPSEEDDDDIIPF